MKIAQQAGVLQNILDLILSKQSPEAIFLLSHASVHCNYDNLFYSNTQTIEQPSACLLLLIINTDKKTVRKYKVALKIFCSI